MCGLRGGLYNFKESYISELGSLHILLWIICIERNVVNALQQIDSFSFIFFSFFFFFLYPETHVLRYSKKFNLLFSFKRLIQESSNHVDTCMCVFSYLLPFFTIWQFAFLSLISYPWIDFEE